MDTKEKKRSRHTATRKSSAAVKPRARKAPPKKRPPRPEVIYTQPPAFSKSGFVLRLVTVVAVVLALALGMSIFFKVKDVTVSGMEKYTPWDVREASGIQEGENLLTLSKAMISGKITTELPYVESVRVGIKLPDTVNIEITELDVVYAIESSDSSWWLINAAGKVVDTTTPAGAEEYTKILGVQLNAPQPGMQAVAAEAAAPAVTVPETTEASQPEETSGETTEPVVTVAPPVTVRGSERLSTALTILQYLEDNGIIGQATSVDVSTVTALELWYEERYQVNLGDTTALSRKIIAMKQAIDQMTGYQNGKLDVSFTTWPDKVGYSPFEAEIS